MSRERAIEVRQPRITRTRALMRPDLGSTAEDGLEAKVEGKMRKLW